MKFLRLKPVLVLYLIIRLFSNSLFADDQGLIISEFMALNSKILQDEDGEYPDWIEIYNPTGDSINLLNWSLTDNDGSRAKWKFPQLKLPPACYLVLFASGKDRRDAGLKNLRNIRSDWCSGVITGQAGLISAFLKMMEQQKNLIR